MILVQNRISPLLHILCQGKVLQLDFAAISKKLDACYFWAMAFEMQKRHFLLSYVHTLVLPRNEFAYKFQNSSFPANIGKFQIVNVISIEIISYLKLLKF